jgi:indolepyruvate decarboxylase
MLPEYTVAKYFVHRLKELGVGHVFGVAGDYTFDVLDRIVDDPEIQMVGTCNELNAGYAADAYAKLKGIGAVTGTFGVGSLSFLSAVAGAYTELVPLVVFSGGPSNSERLIAHQSGLLYHHASYDLANDRNAFRPFTVANELIADPYDAPGQIDAALRACYKWKQPVYLEFARDVYEKECRPPGSPIHEHTGLETPDTKDLERAVAATWKKIESSGRPLILAGAEIARFGLQELFGELLDTIGREYSDCGYFTTLAGKAILPESHSRFAGSYEGTASVKEVRDRVEGSDCLLVLGAWLTEDVMVGTAFDFRNMVVANTRTVRIEGNYYNILGLANFLRKLIEDAPRRPRRLLEAAAAPDSGPGAPVLSFLREDLPLGTRITSDTFFKTLIDEKFIDAGHRVLVDTANSQFCTGDLRIERQDGYLGGVTWGAIGYSVGACLGAACADPEGRPVVFVGDGGFQMTLQEIGTMLRLGQTPILFVFANGIYGLEQAIIEKGEITDKREYNDVPRWRYAALAGVFADVGPCRGWKIDTLEDLRRRLPEIKDDRASLHIVEVTIPWNDVPEAVKRVFGPPSPSQEGISPSFATIAIGR